jgi:hypothetical protein
MVTMTLTLRHSFNMQLILYDTAVTVANNNMIRTRRTYAMENDKKIVCLFA